MARGPKKCGELAIHMIDRLRFYFEQLSDPEVRRGHFGTRCLAFKECRDEMDNIEGELQDALQKQRKGDTCSAISSASNGLRAVHRIEGFLKGAELMEGKR